MANRECPRCQTKMVEKPVKLLTLDTCPDCEGLFFDGGEFDRSLKVIMGIYGNKISQNKILEDEAEILEPDKALTCATCQGEMSRYQVEKAGVEIDACASCGGLWLDAGELEALRAVTDQARANIPRETIEEIKRRPVQSQGLELMSSMAESALAQPHHDHYRYRHRRSGGLLGLLAWVLDDFDSY